ncbi:MAG: tetratricopeptide repeat protein [Muribaculaceae bacterium]|nr:tetratricopeptide repeat protein [Muribaculaceae bacterium]MDE6299874.1 tetratricopeptide repeat protein [Muribaculaceae bacterium]
MKRNPIIILLVLLTAGAAISARTAAPEQSENRAKARYYYLEGARCQAAGKNAEAYEYFKKAYLSDTTYTEAANAYGLMRIWVRGDSMDTPTERVRSLEMMRAFVDQYPTEVSEARTYALTREIFDTVPEAIRVFERLDSLLPPNTATLVGLGEAYLRAGKNDEALGIYSRIEDKEGKNPQITIKKIQIHLEKGDTLGAVAEASALVASNPREPEFRILKGNLYELMGENDSTLAYYQQAEKLNPDAGDAKMALANFYRQQGDSVAYDNKIYEALLTEDFELEDKISILAEYLQTLLQEKNNTQRGDYLFTVLQNQYPHEAEVREFAARYSGAKEDYKEAEVQIGYAIDQDPTNVNYWGELMQFQYADDRPRDAMDTYHKATAYLDPTDGLKLMFASAATEATEYDTALSTYAGMIQKMIPDATLTDSITDKDALSKLSYDDLQALSALYTMAGDVYYRKKDLDKTFKAYDNAMTFLPNNPLTLNNYAYFMTESGGDLDKALEMSARSLDYDRDNPTYLDTYAWILFKRKEFKEALEYQRKAIEMATKEGQEPSAEYYHHYGDILFMNHEPEEALKNWEKALKLEPENALLKKKVTHKTFFFE